MKCSTTSFNQRGAAVAHLDAFNLDIKVFCTNLGKARFCSLPDRRRTSTNLYIAG